MRERHSDQVLVLLLLLSTRFAVLVEGDLDPERPYYIRPKPAIMVTQPLDGILSLGQSLNLTCEVMGMEHIVSRWWPHIYWRHNGSTVNSTWPGNVTIDTNHWDMTTLHTPFPGTYQCIVDDGSFILASRLAKVKEGLGSPEEWTGNVHMVCGGQGAATYTWYKDGIPLDGQETVVVTNETRDPFGLYTCTTAGVIRQWYLPMQTSKENTTVFIDGSPSDIFVGHSGNGMTTEDITLQCNITVPGRAVNVTWFHNGEENVILSSASIPFPTNSNVSIIAGTYVCTASSDNWEARVQFRVMLKHKPNPSDSIHSNCVRDYPEINVQNVELSWTPLGDDRLERVHPDLRQVLVINRQNHSNRTCSIVTGPLYNSYTQTLRLDSDYCISLITTGRMPLEQYFISEGNSTLHRCDGSTHSCQQVQYHKDIAKATKCDIDLISDENVDINCGELQSPNHDTFSCNFMWQRPSAAAQSELWLPYIIARPHYNVTCPAESSKSIKSDDLNWTASVVTSQVSFPASDCLLECQVNVCVRQKDQDCLYTRSGRFTPKSHKLTQPNITCSKFKGKSNITIEVPQDGASRVSQCQQMDAKNNSNVTVTVVANERQFNYSAQLGETLEIETSEITNATGNTTVFVMYTAPATGTSNNSTTINLKDNCPCVTGWRGTQCDEAICTLPCQNGGTCSEPDLCNCSIGWSGSTCSAVIDCDTPTSAPGTNGHYVASNTTYESVVNFICDPGYTLLEPGNRTCQANRQWSGHELQCEPAPSPTDNSAAYAATVVLVLPLLVCFALFILLCYKYKRSKKAMKSLKFDFKLETEWPAAGLDSIVECDTLTVCDDVDTEDWCSGQDVSSDTGSTEIKMATSNYITAGITI